MAFDFNTAEKQQAPGLIPHNTAVPVHMTMRPGGAGDGNWLKRSGKDPSCLMMDCEFTVIEGPFARRKFWSMMVVAGDTDGQKTAVGITHSRLRAILESAKGVMPADESADAVKARQVEGYDDFDSVRFWAIVGEEKGGANSSGGFYKDKNILVGAVTPDKQAWTKLEQVPRQNRGLSAAVISASAPKANAQRPNW